MQCIPNKSDFKIHLQFKDTTNTVVNPLDFEWDVIYYTLPDVKFVASHRFGLEHPDQHILTPNTVILDGNMVEVRVDNFDFCKKGQLKFGGNIHFKNSDFKDGIQTLPLREQTLNISIV